MWPSESLASHLYNLANWGLIAGLIIGACSTIMIAWMGNIKEAYLKRDLAASHERVAHLESDTASLLKQLIEQGPRSHLLYGTNRDELIEELKPFAGQKVEVRICRGSFNQYFADKDAIGVAMLLQDIFEKANWSGSPLVVENCGGTGIQVSFDPNAPEPVRMAASALASALEKLPMTLIANGAVAVATPRSEQPPTYDGTGKLIPLRPLTDDTIVVTVLSHP